MSSPRTVRAYRALLHLYPRRFREEYGDDMALLFRDQLHDESARRVWARCVVDLAITIPTQHLESHMNRPPKSIVPVLFAALGVAGVVFALVVGSSVGLSAVGLAVAVVAGVLATASWRGTRTAAATRPVRTQWWKIVLVGVGTLTATIVVVNVVGEVSEGWWAPMMLAFLVGILTTATGLVLGIGQLTARRARPVVS